MSDQLPASNADANEPNDADTAATVLDDAHMDQTPGGGGLGGAGAADPLAGSARGGGGTAPNSPIGGIPAKADANAAREAQTRSVNDSPAEPHGSSQ